MSLSTFLFSFDGQVSRKQYWLFAAASTVASVVIAFVLHGTSVTLDQRPSLLWTALVLVSLYPSTAVDVKRLNDIGWPPILAYGLAAVSVVYTVCEQFQPFGPINTASAGNVVVWLLLAIGVVGSIVIGCVPGIAGSDAKGPNPRAVRT